jgi:hypothetical protein
LTIAQMSWSQSTRRQRIPLTSAQQMQLNNSLLWRTQISPSYHLMTLFNGEVPTHLFLYKWHEIWTCILSLSFDKSNASYNRRALLILCWIRLLYKEHNFLYYVYIFVLWWIIYLKMHTVKTLARYHSISCLSLNLQVIPQLKWLRFLIFVIFIAIRNNIMKTLENDFTIKMSPFQRRE